MPLPADLSGRLPARVLVTVLGSSVLRWGPRYCAGVLVTYQELGGYLALREVDLKEPWRGL